MKKIRILSLKEKEDILRNAIDRRFRSMILR